MPRLVFDAPHAMALVAVLGMTISPYLFFWQSSQEVEEAHRRHVRPLPLAPREAALELARIRTDTIAGMGISNLIALFIILATAATLNASSVTEIQTSSQAAEALRPVAGPFAFALFAAGIVGTGLLAVPVLAGSAAYATCEVFRWAGSLASPPREAKAFYATIALATLGGVALNFSSLDPIKALYWSAVVNGVLAAPLMGVIMVIAANPRIMGRLTLPFPMKVMGWLARLVMAVVTIGFRALSLQVTPSSTLRCRQGVGNVHVAYLASTARGASIHLVQATLGDASVATTGRYTHARPFDSSARYLGI